MPFAWKQRGIQTQSAQLWRDAGASYRPERERKWNQEVSQITVCLIEILMF